MSERKRSKDGHSETAEILGPDAQADKVGRKGGRLARNIGTRDELKRAMERPAGATRVTKSDEKEKGDG